MSGDEVFVLIVASIVAIVSWSRWFSHLVMISPRWVKARRRMALWLSPLLSAGVLYYILRTYASFDVTGDPTYLIFYMVFGAAWVGLWARTFSALGLSVRDDALERHNEAAAWAVGGALVGATLSFAGANIGDGPGWWVVLFCSLLSMAGFLAAWVVASGVGDAMEAITVERDLAAGIRFAGFLTASGLILGRGAAGNWVSAEEAVVTFVTIAWPVMGLAVLAGFIDKAWRPTPQQPLRSVAAHGILPAVAYVVGAGAYVVSRGWW